LSFDRKACKKVSNWLLKAEYRWLSETSYPGQIERESPETSTAAINQSWLLKTKVLGVASMSIPDQSWLSEWHVYPRFPSSILQVNDMLAARSLDKILPGYENFLTPRWVKDRRWRLGLQDFLTGETIIKLTSTPGEIL
jgi:hypothetical protein